MLVSSSSSSALDRKQQAKGREANNTGDRLATALRDNLKKRKSQQRQRAEGGSTAGISMDSLVIQGGNRLRGTIEISGAKNAALPLMCAAIMTDEALHLTNWPDLADTQSLRALLASLGIASHATADTLTLEATGTRSLLASYDLVRKMRASVLVLGPLLAHLGEARVSLPGGCAIGSRPVDLHIMAMERLGAQVKLNDGYIHAHAPKGGLRGAEIEFPTRSVGATENALMAASLATGTSKLINAAREPEISDLAQCLNSMGARITGHGGDVITIEGVDGLGGATHKVIPDRIEAGTYAMAGVITGGEVTLAGVNPHHLVAVLDALTATGAEVTINPQTDTEDQSSNTHSITIKAGKTPAVAIDMATSAYPGFPTDLQAQFMAYMAVAKGESQISETVFENRFMHVPELQRMGADIHIHNTSHGGVAHIRGCKTLTGAPVMATDLRASVSLVLAGLAAQGETILSRVYHLDRGYYRLEDKLNGCGANIQRVKP